YYPVRDFAVDWLDVGAVEAEFGIGVDEVGLRLRRGLSDEC
ncbi:MAG: hypothetical protein ACI8W7_004207, partial [Gammaproteobacteria bacterium]